MQAEMSWFHNIYIYIIHIYIYTYIYIHTACYITNLYRLDVVEIENMWKYTGVFTWPGGHSFRWIASRIPRIYGISKIPSSQNGNGGAVVEMHKVKKQLTRSARVLVQKRSSTGQVEHRKGSTLGFWTSKVATEHDQGP